MENYDYMIRKVRVVNWHGYSDKEFFFDQETLICGKNANGKSAFMDALGFGLVGDRDFNLAADNGNRRDKRTLKSYNLKLMSADPDEFERKPGECSYILIEIRKNGSGDVKTLGTVVFTAANDSVNVQRFIAAGKGASDFDLYEYQGIKRRVLSSREFAERNKVLYKSGDEAILDFTHSFGLIFGKEKLKEYRRRLSMAKFYTANGSIPDFITKNVLRPGRIDTKNLEDANRTFTEQRKSFDALCREIELLEEVLKAYDEYDSLKHRIDVNSGKMLYTALKGAEAALSSLENQLDTAENSLSRMKKEIESNSSEEKALKDSIDAISRDLISGNAPLKEAEKQLSALEDDRSQLLKEKERLLAFQDAVNKALQNPDISAGLSCNVLSSLLDPSILESEKITAIRALNAALLAAAEKLRRNLIRTEDSITDCSERCRTFEMQIRDLENSRNTFSHVPDAVRLRDDINAEFKRLHIDAAARLACEYVESIDPVWQDAIESYMGRQRYAVLIPAAYHNIAHGVWRKNRKDRYRNAELINTKKLAERNIRKEVPNSLLSKITVSGTDAVRFFAYKLGFITAAESDEDTKNYDFAVSAEGAMEADISEKSLDFSKIGPYAFGQEAVKRNLEKAKESLSFERNRLNALRSEESGSRSSLNKYTAVQKLFDMPYVYGIESELKESERKVSKARLELENLRTAMLKDEAASHLLQLLDDKRSSLRKVQDLLSSLKSKEYTAIQKKSDINARKETAAENLLGCTDAFDRFKAENLLAAQEAVRDVEAGKNVWTEETARKNTSRLESLLNGPSGLVAVQTKYCISQSAAMPRGKEGRGDYQERYDRIRMGRREETKAAMEEAQLHYEDIIRNDIVYRIYQDYMDCQEDKRIINKRLAKTNFKDAYSLVVERNSDEKGRIILGYGKILYDRKAAGGQEDLFSFMNTPKEEPDEEMLWNGVKDIFSSALGREDKNAMQKDLKSICDYRSYIQADMEVTNKASGRKGRLSRLSRYNSGGEGRIPRFLLVICALQVLYDESPECLRFVMIDEPFEKIDSNNVRELMRYIHEQGLQIAICSSDFRILEPLCSAQNFVSIDNETKNVEVINRVKNHAA